ncbi:MAG: MYXO-CTERM sorting domain-containing protein, partial [Myxococcales bacterium]
YAVALSGNTLLVGAPGTTVGTKGGAGVAYVFVRSGTTWTQQGPSFTSSDIHSSDQFGAAVSLSGDTALIGAYQKTLGVTTSQEGAAYVFQRSGSTWSQQGAPLVAADAGDADWFGWSVALASNTAVIGAPYQTQGTATEQGAAYVFQRSGATWSQAGSKLSAGSATTNFGASVSISSSTLIAGGPGATVGQVKAQGSAYVYFRAGAPGDACTSGSDCANGFCSNDVCCDQACDGACDACSVTAGAVKDGSCKVLAKGAPGTPACQSLACNGVSATCVACAHDSECTSGHYCAANGTCRPRVAQGDSCNPAAGKDCKEAGCEVCATGNCADGVCCDQACTHACQACTLALTGAPDGKCAPIPADQDPKQQCDEGQDYPASCLSDGLCDGMGSCRDFAKPSTPCGETRCAKGAVSGKLCDGAGTCSTDTAACAPYVCGGDACTTQCQTDDDCATSGYCLDGTCQAKKDLGEDCGSTVQCASNFCTDGVCCEAACDGQCEVCNAAGACQAVKGEPRAGRAACNGDPAVCGGACDGKARDHCAYPSSAQSCGNACADGQELPSVCNAAGACVESSPIPCGNYACGDTECLTACAGSSDCAAGFGCVDSSCQPTASKCSDDLRSSITEDDVATLCAPYVCDASSGSCKTECTSVDDCASGSVCNANKSCVPAAGNKSVDTGGCGCEVPGPPRSNGAWLMLLGLAMAWRRRHSVCHKRRASTSASRAEHLTSTLISS